MKLGYLSLFMMVVYVSCIKPVDINNPSSIDIVTDSAQSVSFTSVIVGGKITKEGRSALIERGVCYSITSSPNLQHMKQRSGTGLGVYQITLANLSPGTRYYYRAYAFNSTDTAYGNILEFTTKTIDISTSEANGITASSAVLGGTVNSEGGSTLLERGICYSTTPLPTVLNIKSPSGTGLGSFQVSLQNLLPDTRYFYRAYAYNALDTAYGGHKEFTTDPLYPRVQTISLTTPTTSNISCSSRVTSAGASPIIARGVCWAETAGPTVNNSKTSDGAAVGDFTSFVTGLRQNTTYFIRSYATNTQGTSYGNEMTFTTPKPTNADLNQIQFLDNNTGFIVGRGIVLKTTSGGDSWTVIKESTTIEFTAVQFINAQLGFVGGSDQYYAYIYKTTDGGLTWVQQDRWWSSNEPMRINGIQTSDGVRVACELSIRSNSTINGQFFSTTNGGTTWVGQNFYFRGLNCGDQFNGKLYIGGNYYSTGTGAGSYVYTSNFPSTGSPDLTGNLITGVVIDIYGIQMTQNYGYAAGSSGRMLISGDNGVNWTVRSLPGYANETFYGIRFNSLNNGFIIGTNGVLLRTIDGGVSWSREASYTTQTLRGIAIKPDGTVFAVGNSGEIFRKLF
jgi:photosystem II stability/assembly factor-like uncharacterized protein